MDIKFTEPATLLGVEVGQDQTDRRAHRVINLWYEREINVLPGWTVVKEFEYEAEQPLLSCPRHPAVVFVLGFLAKCFLFTVR